MTQPDPTDSLLEERERTHGNRYEFAPRLAALWEAYLGVPLNPADVWYMMAQLKMLRQRLGAYMHADHHKDILGYAKLGVDQVANDKETLLSEGHTNAY